MYQLNKEIIIQFIYNDYTVIFIYKNNIHIILNKIVILILLNVQCICYTISANSKTVLSTSDFLQRLFFTNRSLELSAIPACIPSFLIRINSKRVSERVIFNDHINGRIGRILNQFGIKDDFTSQKLQSILDETKDLFPDSQKSCIYIKFLVRIEINFILDRQKDKQQFAMRNIKTIEKSKNLALRTMF